MSVSIVLDSITKKFERDVLFKNISLTFNTSDIIAITGSNGSGKSTFLKILIGLIPPTLGNIYWKENKKGIDINDLFKYISFTAPYIDLVEEFTLKELYHFHHELSPLTVDFNSFAKIIYLEKFKDKQIQFFSSGMKQRVKLGLTLLSNAPIIILDEPTNNLDEKGINLYNQLLTENANNKLIFIASNIAAEYKQATQIIYLPDYL